MKKAYLIKILIFGIILSALIFYVPNFLLSKTKETGISIDQSFLKQFVIDGGPIVWFILLPMSLLTVYFAAEYLLIIRRKKLIPSQIGDEILSVIDRSGVGGLVKEISSNDDLLSVALHSALTKGKGDWFRTKGLVTESLQDQAMSLLRKIEWISLIGNVSPMVGLFGTVFGMIKLFNSIVITGGQPQPADLAGGISVALVTTFWGLFIAIPALGIYGIFKNRIETLVSDAVTESENVMVQIRQFLMTQQNEKKKSLAKENRA